MSTDLDLKYQRFLGVCIVFGFSTDRVLDCRENPYKYKLTPEQVSSIYKEAHDDILDILFDRCSSRGMAEGVDKEMWPSFSPHEWKDLLVRLAMKYTACEMYPRLKDHPEWQI